MKLRGKALVPARFQRTEGAYVSAFFMYFNKFDQDHPGLPRLSMAVRTHGGRIV